MHEARSTTAVSRRTGVTIDYLQGDGSTSGYHPMTMYFPWVVQARCCRAHQSESNGESRRLYTCACAGGRGEGGPARKLRGAPHLASDTLDETLRRAKPVLAEPEAAGAKRGVTKRFFQVA